MELYIRSRTDSVANYSTGGGSSTEIQLNQTWPYTDCATGSGLTPGQAGCYNGVDGSVGNWSGTNLTTATIIYDRQLEFALQPYSLTHLLGTSITLGTMILATIIGNVFVIAAIVLERNLHSVANYLIASLAVADLMVASLVMPLAAVNEVSTQWFLGPEICDMWISFDVLCCTCSILHLVAIAMDRYWAVTRVDYIRNRSARRILVMIAMSWVISATISIPPLFGWKDSDNKPELSGECMISQDYGYTIFSTVGAFYLPLLCMIVIYIKIFQAARSRIRKKRFVAYNNVNVTESVPETVTETPRSMVSMSTADGTPMTQLSSRTQSPEHSSNGSAAPLHANDANRNSKQTLSPPTTPLLVEQGQRSGSFLDITKVYLDFRRGGGAKTCTTTTAATATPTSQSPKRRERERQREKLEQKRERKAARTLGIITGSFVSCWLPFFIVALVRPFCGDRCHPPLWVISIIGWLGYFNSLLNPIIYTIFNPDFRHAFRKILFGRYRGNRHGRR